MTIGDHVAAACFLAQGLIGKRGSARRPLFRMRRGSSCQDKKGMLVWPMKYIEHPITRRAIPEYATGVFVPVFTPALEGGRLDPKGLANYVDWLARDPAVTSLFVRCGSGQMYCYSVGEVKQAIDITMETLNGRKYAFFGTFGEFAGKETERPAPSAYLDQTLELSQYAEQQSATGIVLLVPWALEADDGESIEDLQVRHYRTVAESVRCPVFIYNTPAMAEGYRLTADVIKRIKGLSNIAGAKISTVDLAWVSELEMAAQDSQFILVSGHEGCYFPWLVTGALGVIGQGCNVYPRAIRAVYDAFMRGDWPTACRAQQDILRMLSCFSGYGNSIPGLAYLRSKGLQIEPWDKSGLPLTSPADIAPVVAGIDSVLQQYV
jgi:dihydrodipicolinate synthase/N-acetylneuraminate lyase